MAKEKGQVSVPKRTDIFFNFSFIVLGFLHPYIYVYPLQYCLRTHQWTIDDLFVVCKISFRVMLVRFSRTRMYSLFLESVCDFHLTQTNARTTPTTLGCILWCPTDRSVKHRLLGIDCRLASGPDCAALSCRKSWMSKAFALHASLNQCALSQLSSALWRTSSPIEIKNTYKYLQYTHTERHTLSSHIWTVFPHRRSAERVVAFKTSHYFKQIFT